MAFSSSEGKETFRDWLNHVAKPLRFETFLDVGAGAGAYGQIIRDVFGETVTINAVEVYLPYLFRYHLSEKYNGIICQDIRDICDGLPNYDLIVAGDVIEHLSKTDAIRVVKTLLHKCKFMWCAMPVKIGRPWSTGYCQGECEWQENRYNKHEWNWTGEEIQEEFKPLFLIPFIQIGVFLIEGSCVDV